MPLELDEVRVFSTLDKAVDCLHHLYEDKLNEVEPYGEVDHYCADDMYEITLTEDCGTTFYQGYVRTKMVEWGKERCLNIVLKLV